jgi:rhodanese-related sulfurtransferase
MGFFRLFSKKDQALTLPSIATTPTVSPPPQVKEMSVETLKAKLDNGETPLIIDVREPWEYDIAHLRQAIHIPMNTIPQRLATLDPHAEIVVQCHHGGRSWHVANFLIQHGFTNVSNLSGGIDAWARRIERTMRTY